ncbi:carbohydrate sulfotransferase 11-like [Branchiostoma lanceolatum]|uniref:carbohydrate sulfotransferase 11-like n=1 Tax=Branchiostoma lanceolatum TaxID=7740 RepID=UPI003454D8FF
MAICKHYQTKLFVVFNIVAIASICYYGEVSFRRIPSISRITGTFKHLGNATSIGTANTTEAPQPWTFNTSDGQGTPDYTPVKGVSKATKPHRKLKLKASSDPVEQRQSERLKRFKQYCNSNSTGSKRFSPAIDRGRYAVSDKYKLIYCFVPKTGSTTTAHVFYQLEHGRGANKFLNKTPGLYLKRLSDYTKEEARLRMRTYTKFITARDPIQRLESAWIEKFFKGPQRDEYTEKYQSMLETVPHLNLQTKSSSNATQPVGRVGNNSLQPIPFIAFMKAVAEQREKWSNSHWVPAHERCSPCQVDWDFILHTDTLAEDYHHMFQKLGMGDMEDILPPVRPRKAGANFQERFRDIPLGILWRLKEIYKPDYEMFGFSQENELKKILHIDSDS